MGSSLVTSSQSASMIATVGAPATAENATTVTRTTTTTTGTTTTATAVTARNTVDTLTKTTAGTRVHPKRAFVFAVGEGQGRYGGSVKDAARVRLAKVRAIVGWAEDECEDRLEGRLENVDDWLIRCFEVKCGLPACLTDFMTS